MKTVFVDIDTQLDFLYPTGALYVPGAESIVDNLARLNQHAGAQGIPLISTMDAHRENDAEFVNWPPHCILGCLGQRKPSSTVLSEQAIIPYDVEAAVLPMAKQIVVQKRVLDAFRNPNLPRLLEHLGADRFVVYGVVTEICVHYAAAGLLKTGAKVAIVQDAVKSIDNAAAKAMFAEVRQQGATLTSVAEVLS